MKTAQQAAQNWSGSSGRATTAYTEGVNNTTADWAGNTVRQQSVMQANWLASLSTWANRVQEVGTAGWKSATQAKAANYGTGFSAGANNYAAAAQKLIPFLQSAVAALPPRGDINANLQRSAALAMALHQQRGNFRA